MPLQCPQSRPAGAAEHGARRWKNHVVASATASSTRTNAGVRAFLPRIFAGTRHHIAAQPANAYPSCLQSKTGRAAVKAHNSVATVLVEYESAWHAAWCDAIRRSKVGVNAPVLAIEPSTRRYAVNLDRSVWQLVREAQCLGRLGFHVPQVATDLSERSDSMRDVQAALTQTLSRYALAPDR